MHKSSQAKKGEPSPLNSTLVETVIKAHVVNFLKCDFKINKYRICDLVKREYIIESVRNPPINNCHLSFTKKPNYPKVFKEIYK